MARRSARRTYVRDGRGRFASTGTTTAKAKPAARRAQRGTNRITRDNSGKITGVGKNGATARGGRLRTAAGNQRGAVLDRMKRRQSPAGTIRASDAAMARVANSASKRIERRNKSGENPPWAGRENSGSRLRRAKARIADQKARQGGAQPPMRPVSAGKLSRAKARTKAVEGRGQRIQQAILSTQDSPVAAGMRYAAARAAGTPIPKRELNRLTRDMRSYQKALRSTMTAQRAMAFYGKSKPKPAAPKQAKAARPSGTIRKPQGLKPGAIAARKAKAKTVKAGPSPSLVAGARRRASERPEVALQRKKQRAIAKYSEASQKAAQTKTALFRRRGKLEPDQRRIVSKENRKANKAVNNLRDAIGLYNQQITDATLRRDMMVAYRSSKKAPITPRKLANTVRTLQNKLKLQKGDGLYPADIEKTSKALRAASQELAKVGGVRMTFRTKQAAIRRQRARAVGVMSYRLNNNGGVWGYTKREALRNATPDQRAPEALKARRKRGQLNMFGGSDLLPTRGRAVFSGSLEYRAKKRKRRNSNR
jgi:hypothetical protein